MAQDERPEVPDPLEERLRRRLRYATGFTLLGLITVLVFAQTFSLGHVEPWMFGALIGLLAPIVGIELLVPIWTRSNGNGKK